MKMGTPTTDNPILVLSFNFSIKIIKFIDSNSWGNKFVLSNQLLKSATSIGANIREAQSAESKNDFIHKIKIASKEAEEKEYWLLILQEIGMDTKLLLSDLLVIKKIISRIIATSKNKTKL